VTKLAELAYRAGELAEFQSAAASPAANDFPNFLRGYFDARGSLSEIASEVLECWLPLPENQRLLRTLLDEFGGSLDRDRRRIFWLESEALDFLATLYDDASLFDESKRRQYLAWATHGPLDGGTRLPLELQWRALRPDAVAPFKQRASDSGYDVTLLAKAKQHGPVTLYGTGIQVRPPAGYYFDVVPRSSIIKLGYLLANSVGVIDRGYRGELMVPLVKVAPEVAELELPARVVQLIPRPIVHFPVRQRDSLDDTQRGSGGFGSTDR
jgi:dUTP pyrophosphatase